MTLLVVVGKSGHISSIEDCATPGLASQKARTYADSGLTCQLVPDELREDVEYLMGQMKEKREDGFIREYGIVPNGTRSKGEGARTLGRMIYPALGGKLEEQNPTVARSGSTLERQPDMTAPLTFSSGDLIFGTKN